MRPRLGVLDWELWGTAPAGTDTATLLCYGLLAPEVVEQVRGRFGDVLDSPSGRVAQLYVVARLLRRIDGGDYPELAEPLTAHARTYSPSDGEDQPRTGEEFRGGRPVPRPTDGHRRARVARA